MLWTVLSAIGGTSVLRSLAKASADGGLRILDGEDVRSLCARTLAIEPGIAVARRRPEPPERILRQALSIAVAVASFGPASGIAAREAGLSIYEAMGFSSLVFTGSAQFAAVGVLSDGGSALTAVLAGGLLNLRSLAFGVAFAPDLGGSRRFRTAAAATALARMF